MESEKVKKIFENKCGLTNDESMKFISSLFAQKLSYFRKNKADNMGMFFDLEYHYKNCIIYFGGDRGDLIYSLNVKGNEIDLSKYDSLIKNAIQLSEKNIQYVFNVIKEYLEEHHLVV